MDRMLNAFKAYSGNQDASAGQPRFATVTSVDAALGTVRVQLQPEGVLTGWLPMLSPWVGNGWGMTCPPSPGDQVFVLAQEGDAENGIVIGRSWGQGATIPNTPLGEFWLTHQSGSSVRLLNDGSIYIKGDLHVVGNIFDQHGSLQQLRADYNQHTHAVPKGGTTSIPTPQN